MIEIIIMLISFYEMILSFFFTRYQNIIEYPIIIYFMYLNYIILITKFKKRIMKKKINSINQYALFEHNVKMTIRFHRFAN